MVRVENKFQETLKEDAFDKIVFNICVRLEYSSDNIDEIRKILRSNQKGKFGQLFQREIELIFQASKGVLIDPKITYWGLMIFLNNPVTLELTRDIYDKLNASYTLKGVEKYYSYQGFEFLMGAHQDRLSPVLNTMMQNVLREIQL